MIKTSTTPSPISLSPEYITLFNAMPEDVCVGRYIGTNNAGFLDFELLFLNKFSLDKTPEAAHLTHQSIWKLFPELLVNGFYEKLVDVFKNGHSQRIELCIELLGKPIHISALVVKINDYLIAYSQDISKQKAIEKSIIDKNKMLDEAHKILEMSTWELDLEKGEISSNTDLYKFFGIPRQSNSKTLTLDQYYSFLFKEDIEGAKANFAHIIKAQQSFILERRLTTASGNDKYVEVTGKPIYNFDKCVKLIGTFRNITKRKFQELQMLQNDLLINDAKELLHMCVWKFDPSNQQMHYSKELSQILEYDTPIEFNSFDDYLKHIHPEEVELTKKNYNTTVANNDFNFKAIRRMITAKGNTKYVEMVGKSILENGKLSKVFGTIRDITQEKTIALAKAEQEYQIKEAHRILSMGTWGFDEFNKTVYFSEELSRILEFDKIEPIISDDIFSSHIHPDDMANRDAIRESIRTGAIDNFRTERKMISAKGNIKYIEISGVRYLHNGKLAKVFGTFRNITEQKIQSIELRDKEIKLQEAHRILKLGTWHSNEKTGKSYFSNELAEILELDTIKPFDSFNDYLKFIHPDDIKSARKNKLMIQSGLIDQFRLERKMLSSKGHVRYIEIAGKGYYENEVLTGVFGTFRDITKEKEHELNLINQDLKNTEIQKILKIGTWGADANNQSCYFDKELSEILEYDEPIVIKQYEEFLKHVATEEIDEVQTITQNLSSIPNYKFRADRKMISAKGNIKYLEFTGKSYQVNEQFSHIIGTFKDITENKKKSIVLLEKENKLANAHKLLKMGNWGFDLVTRSLYYSKELSEILGYECPIEFNDIEQYFAHVHNDSKKDARENYFKIISQTSPNHQFTVDRKLIKQNGAICYVEFNGEALFNNNGERIKINGTFRDITEKKIQELKLQESEKQLTEARALLKMGSLTYDFVNNTQYFSKEMSEILEYDVQKEITSYEEVTAHFTEEDRIKSAELFAKALEGGIKEHTDERQVITQKGNKRYIEFVSELIFNNGKPFKAFGTFRDITERKNQELKLIESERKLKDAHKLFKMGHLELDLINNSHFFTKEMSEILEYDEPFEFTNNEQLIKHTPPEELEEAKKIFKQLITTEGQLKVERKYISKKGNVKYIELIGQTFFENGKPTKVFGSYRDITEKKIQDLIILENEQRLKEAQAILKTGTWNYNTTTKILNLSEETKTILNDKLPLSMHSTEYFKFINPIHRDKFIHLFNETVLANQNVKAINNFVFDDGSSYFIEVIGYPSLITDESTTYTGTFRDVTEEYKKDLALKDSEERFRLLFENNPTMYFTLDDKGFILSVNQFGLDYLGYTKDELINNHTSTVFFAEDAAKAIKNLELLKHSYNNFLQWEIRKVKKSGEIIWVKETARIAKNKHGSTNYLIVCEDITSEVLNRELIRKKQHELLIAKEKAEDAAREKQQFASIMSHEIRTPLNAVIGITNLLLMENPKPEQVNELNTLKFAGESLLMLVNDILDFSKIEAGKVVLEKISFDLPVLIRNVRNSYTYKADEKGITINAIIDEEIPHELIGDPVRISQILNNLVSNAIKFTEKGFVDLSLRKMKSTNENEIRIRFEITDSGIGIPKNKQKLVFESFSQANSDTTRKYGGTGLGLTITKKLVELHNSSIELISEHGKGTTFYFDVSFGIAEKYSSLDTHEETFIETKNIDGKRVLLVEDNAFNQLIATKFLHKWNAIVDVAENGKIALEKVTLNNYDIILMDIQMPEMNGIEATIAIRKHNNISLQKIPIIALTAAAMEAEREHLLLAGMNDYISKPFNPNELYKKILKYV